MIEYSLVSIDYVIEKRQLGNTKNPVRNARDWLSKNKIKRFRKGIYVKEFIDCALEREIQKCYKFPKEKAQKITEFAGLLRGDVSAHVSMKAQKLLQDKKRLNMRMS